MKKIIPRETESLFFDRQREEETLVPLAMEFGWEGRNQISYA
jgi:hypothetical protein